MKKDFIYFFRQVDLLRFNYLSPLNYYLATTLLLYTKRQNKINIYTHSFFFSFLVLFSFFFL